MYDLNLIPIHYRQGKIRPDLTGFFAAGPPRRPARGRSDDLLVISFTPSGQHEIAGEVQQSWMTSLARMYFKTAGSVTAAMRTVIQRLNLTLMEKNLKTAQGGGTISAEINLSVIHRQHLYIAQSGSTHAYVLTREGLHHYYDSDAADHGLGISRSPAIRYFQTDLGEGGYLFMTRTPSPTWTQEVLDSGVFPTLDQLRRRLVNQAPADFNVDLVEIIGGKGRINLIRPIIRKEAFQDSSPKDTASNPAMRQTTRRAARPPEPVEDLKVSDLLPSPEQDKNTDSSARDQDLKTHRMTNTPHQRTQANLPDKEVPEKKEAGPAPQQKSSSQSLIHPEPIKPVSGRSSTKAKKSQDRSSLNERAGEIEEKGLKGLAAFFDWWRQSRQRVQSAFQSVVSRWAPEGESQLPRMSRGTLLFIAVAVPLVVVSIAIGVYLSRGKDQQYQMLYDQALSNAESAQTAENTSVARGHWTQTLILLEQASAYRQTEELDHLMAQAQFELDMLDGVIRLDYQPALVSGLHDEVNVTRIITLGADLYLFDSNSGSVIHAIRTGERYQVDSDFICASGAYGENQVNTLVDMAGLPINNLYQAHLLAVDGGGNLLFCSSGQDPIAATLPSYAGSQGQISRVTFSNGYLYALDAASENLLVYPSNNMQFNKDPQDYFEGLPYEQRPDLRKVVDLALSGNDLFFLRPDGYLDRCVASGAEDTPVTCELALSYEDTRQGMEGQNVVMPTSSFASLLFTPPPDPGLNILEVKNGDIFRFSLQLKLYQRLRPEINPNYEMELQDATAFAIGIDRVYFLAFGNHVFFYSLN